MGARKVKQEAHRARHQAHREEGGEGEVRKMSHETRLAVLQADAYDAEILRVRRVVPGEGYREDVHFGVGDHECLSDITFMDISDLLEHRVWDGSTPGCCNRLWFITEDQANALRELNRKKVAAREAREAARAKEEEEREKRLLAAGLCPLCGTFCCGDCQAHG